MKKIYIFLLSLSLAYSAANAQSVSEKISQGEFSYLLIRALGHEAFLPENYGELDEQQQWVECVNLLKKRLPFFNNVLPDRPVTLEVLALSVYPFVESASNLTESPAIIQLLHQRGFVPLGNPYDSMDRETVLNTLQLLPKDEAVLAYEEPKSEAPTNFSFVNQQYEQTYMEPVSGE